MGIDDKDQFHKLLAMPGVFGVMIINGDGLAVHSSLSHEETLKYGGVAQLVGKARKIMKELTLGDDHLNEAAASGGPGNASHPHHPDDLTFIKIRTMNYEILVSPCDNDEYSMVALQKPLNYELEVETDEGNKDKVKSQK